MERVFREGNRPSASRHEAEGGAHQPGPADFGCGRGSQGKLAMGHNLWLYFGVDEHPFATYFDVHQGYRLLTRSQLFPSNLAFFFSGGGSSFLDGSLF